jgi:hypothetical protein
MKPTRYAEPPAPPTLAEIAAAVRPSFSYRMAEQAYLDAKAARDAARDAIRAEQALGTERYGSNATRDDAKVAALDADFAGPLADRYYRAKADRREAREAHGTAVANALAPHRRAAGQRLVEALAVVEAARADIVEIDRLCLAHGLDLGFAAPYSTDIEVLRRLADRAQRA